MKPLHRSLLFWLALLPGLFLLGAWVDSFVHHTWVTSYPRGRQIAVWHYDGIVSLRLTGSKVTGIDSIIVRESAFRPDDGKPREIFPQPAYASPLHSPLAALRGMAHPLPHRAWRAQKAPPSAKPVTVRSIRFHHRVK